MGTPRRPHKVKIFIGLLSNSSGLVSDIKPVLAKSFGPVDYESPVSDFTHTDYYREEMGSGLKRVFVSFERLCDLGNICSVKLRTNAIERRCVRMGNRPINVDPGYLDLSKVVLFSTKDFTHRVYLDRGIFAEVTLFYRDGRYNPWPWTYPDYKSAGCAAAFEAMRDIYKAQITDRRTN